MWVVIFSLPSAARLPSSDLWDMVLRFLLPALLGLGLGKELTRAPAIATTSSQRTAHHVPPAAPLGRLPLVFRSPCRRCPLAAAAPLAYGNGGIAGNGSFPNGVGLGLAGHGLAAPPPTEMGNCR
ncbi:hypothetical protein TNIN_152011 [Trichonephila inaurata madagascariensis]|uniref:Uncharacterized protein n=1 Tax=Trichonephila inaurata madagascariensis TaxID=2747483 RepID=A0A8X7BQ93_9ARAC|nr:hypothetical protein TNIN_152011 [Trichonephila inaurata madagascariensis]